jgi:hypothetical protein
MPSPRVPDYVTIATRSDMDRVYCLCLVGNARGVLQPMHEISTISNFLLSTTVHCSHFVKCVFYCLCNFVCYVLYNMCICVFRLTVVLLPKGISQFAVQINK